MTIALIAVGALVAIFIAVEVVLRLIARCELARIATLSPAAQRKYKEDVSLVQLLIGDVDIKFDEFAVRTYAL